MPIPMKRARRFVLWTGLILFGVMSVAAGRFALRYENRRTGFQPMTATRSAYISPPILPAFQQTLLTELDRQVHANIRYRDGYFSGGDPPAHLGVCTDVILRAYRKAGIDLQRDVASDIRTHRRDYAIAKPDPNIDHRRCRNLIVYLRRRGRSLPTSGSQADWQPGDIVFWDTANNGKVDHVGMIANSRDRDGNPSIVHHWPGLPVSETDGLFRYTIRGHFRLTSPRPNPPPPFPKGKRENPYLQVPSL